MQGVPEEQRSFDKSSLFWRPVLVSAALGLATVRCRPISLLLPLHALEAIGSTYIGSWLLVTLIEGRQGPTYGPTIDFVRGDHFSPFFILQWEGHSCRFAFFDRPIRQPESVQNPEIRFDVNKQSPIALKLGYKPLATEVFMPAYTAWPAPPRRPAPPATSAQPLALS